jgi:hypothetical protein
MNEDVAARRNWVRRSVGIAVCGSPIALLVCSFIAGFRDGQRNTFAFVWFAVAALIVAAVNVYLSFVRPWLLLCRLGSLEGIRHVSGFPVVGTVFATISGILGFGAAGTALVGLVAMALDTGGAPWFLASTWRQSDLWDTPR